jgi:4-amino-4-deoxy-L-arabinose transferase-like glycosyltransferase
VASAAWLGLILGVAILARPVVQFVPVLAALLMVTCADRRRALASVAAMALLCALVVSPWIVRNTVVLGSPVMTTNGGSNLRMAYNEGFTGLYNLNGLDPQVPILEPADEILADSTYRERALRFIAQDPLRALAVITQNTWMLFAPPLPAMRISSAGAIARHTAAMLSVVARLILTIFSVIALAQSKARGNLAVSVASALVLAWITAHALSAPGSPRYLASILPLMVILLLWVLQTTTEPRLAMVASKSEPCERRPVE